MEDVGRADPGSAPSPAGAGLEYDGGRYGAQRMKTAAVIAEWNPFHNGHAYFLKEVRKRSGADYIIAVMSGDFVQRGAPAIVDKYLRTEMALDGGADLVLELPVAAATGSAGEFAAGAVGLLEKTGAADELWFGSECGEISPFLKAAEFLETESDVFKNKLRNALGNGRSYPAARAEAAAAAFTGGNRDFPGEKLFSEPNNILGLEYCSALRKCGSLIRPHTILRKGAGYHASVPRAADLYPSAAMIRRMLGTGAQGGKNAGPDPGAEGSCEVSELLRKSMPEKAASLLWNAVNTGSVPVIDDFSAMLFYRLLQETPVSLMRYHGMTEALANRIMTKKNQCRTITELAEAVKAKHLTRSGIDRKLVRVLLGIDEAAFKEAMDVRVLRVLGFRNCDALLNHMHRYASVPYEMRVSSIPEEAYKTDLFASHIYEWVRAGKSNMNFQDEYRRMVVK